MQFSDMQTILMFAQKYEASTVTLEFDYGTMTCTPNRALEEFDRMTLSEPFTIHSISFN